MFHRLSLGVLAPGCSKDAAVRVVELEDFPGMRRCRCHIPEHEDPGVTGTLDG